MSDNSATETPSSILAADARLLLSRFKEIFGLKAVMTGSESSKRCIMRVIAKDVEETMKAQETRRVQAEFQNEDRS